MNAHGSGSPPTPVRRAEVAGVLAMAADLGMGQPIDQALRGAALSVAFARALGLPPPEVARCHAVALLRHAGCTADTDVAVATFGDEVEARRWLATADFGKPADVLGHVFRHHGAGQPALARLRMIATALTQMSNLYGTALSHCEVSRELAARLGYGEDVQAALTMVFERWDRAGVPGKVRGADVDVAVRVTQLCHDVEVFYRIGGASAATEMLRLRSGGSFDPALVGRFVADAPALLPTLDAASAWQAMLDADPDPDPLDEAALDTALGGVADFADLRSSFTVGHSRGVARLVEVAAAAAGLDPVPLVRAAWLHDLGRAAVSGRVWDKAGPLDQTERELAESHVWHADRCLSRSAGLSPYGAVATQAHERGDGSGYFRRLHNPGAGAALLAAADVYHALIEARPHRPAFAPEAAARLLGEQVAARRLDHHAVDAVLAAAGHAVAPRPNPAGLSDREVEVLRLIARGRSNRQAAQRLGVSPKTVDNHVQHIYVKIGVSTRSGATIFAMRHELLGAMG